ncbi:ATP-dependent RNA helicase HrpA [Aestuariibacter sp. GS-14]|uniref:ATP-dependent RNA helicase HrpA n=1 Tax=Aestuariibacter sp. GS-14 TaxID=2590670 RepID=UPI0011296B1E|nr:ATP-dependent RNA helicase HrpA [Aestuariibacter sp. GS-14]TPV60056.1 ATP-dependent RNA helicase HrpA [Aestuariibacter sp. GS-14]
MPNPAPFKALFSQLPQCAIADRFSIRRQLQHLQKANLADESVQQQLAKVIDRLNASIARCEERAAAVPKIEYPPLPVSERKDDIKEAIANHQVVIIAGETGSGKTTQIPKICLELGRGITGKIAHTQPRRLAARSVASRIAEELGTQIGEKVGFKIRFSDQVSDNTLVKLMTDGMLLAEMQQDRFLNEYDTIIIDEAHERSLNIDFLIGYLKQLLVKRPELKVIVTSATIDPERFSRYFNDAPIIEVSGRTFPVEIRYHDPQDSEEEQDQVDRIINAVDELMREPRGDILVFLSGEREIRDTQDALSKQQYRNTEIIPLYARLSASEQQRIFQPHGGRRIVLSTNVAETSLTVPGIKYVIDPGTARISRYSPRSKVQRLPIEPVSQASANQRAGRCGRVSEGICIRLYSEDDYENRPAFTDPEILRTNLASVILQMLTLGLGDIASFDFVQPPDSRQINDGFRLLEEIQAIERRKGQPRLTQLGRQISRLPVDPRYARMVVAAGEYNSLMEVIVIAAGLTIQDPRERPQEKRAQADEKHSEFADKDSDFIALWNLWQAFREKQNELTNNQLRKWCQTNFINYLRMREWQDIVSQLRKSVAELDLRITQQAADYASIHQALCTGLLSHIGMKDKEREYLGARNTRFMIFPGSGLSRANPRWVVAAELVETSKLFARMVAKIDPAWIERLAGHLINQHYSEPHWSKKRGAVTASEKVTLFGLPIVAQRLVTYSQIDPPVCHQLFIREALVNGDTRLQYDVLQDNQALLQLADDWEQKTRRRDLMVDEQQLVDFYAAKLPVAVNSEAAFKKWAKQKDALASLRFTEQDVFVQQPGTGLANAFPDSWQQGNLTLPLRYHFEPNAIDDGVTVSIPLPLLNQVVADGFDWQVPGLRHELVVQLIKSLPKRLRRNFVPAPNYAEACLADMKEADEKTGKPIPLLEALAQKLLRMTGVAVTPEDWQLDQLDKHLVMHFEVVDANRKVLANGNDLEALKQTLQGKVKQTFEKAATPELERKDITSWDFDALPQSFTQKHGGFEVQAYPALVVKGKRVDIELLPEAEQAEKQHQQGLNRLLMVNMPSPVSYLEQKLPNKAKLGLYFNPFGQIKALIDDCILAGIDALSTRFQEQSGCIVREKAQFDACLDYVRANINDEVLVIAQLVETGLTLAHECQKKMKGKVSFDMVTGLSHVKSHLSTLVFPGFVAEFGRSRLEDWNRYLKALARRLEKLAVDPNRDRMQQLAVEKVESRYQSVLAKYPKHKVPEELLAVRWMIEELRVSLFAQQLGTAIPISAKRIENQLESF